MHVHGEAAWRAAELGVACELLGQPDRVLAMGGGMPAIPGVLDAIREAKEAGQLIVIYLAADPTLLGERLSASPGDRSSLTGQGLIEESHSSMRIETPGTIGGRHHLSVFDEPACDTSAVYLACRRLLRFPKVQRTCFRLHRSQLRSSCVCG